MKDNMNENEHSNIMTFGKPQGTINVIPHPEDVIDVDPFVISNLKARLNGESLENVYDLTDRTFDELSLIREKNKLKKVLGSEVQLQEAFSSIKAMKVFREEMSFEDVNQDLLSRYSYCVSNENNVDEYDFYRSFLFGHSVVTKNDRISRINYHGTFVILLEDYKMNHFDSLRISKEAIAMSPDLLALFKEKKLASKFNDFLKEFYRLRL